MMHYTIPYYTTVNYTTPHHTTPHYTTPHYTILHYTSPHYTTLHYTTLHHTILHYTTPSIRQGEGVTELGNGLYSVTIPGEPVAWLFSRDTPTPYSFGRDTLDSVSETRPKGGSAYLIEVQYFFSMDTGQGAYRGVIGVWDVL